MHRFGINSLLPAVIIVAAFWSGPALAGEHAPFTARSGSGLTRDAALIWSSDARLIYLENDEPVGSDGSAIRWGYLYYSALLGKARCYSVRDGEIIEASDLGFDFEAPPLPDNWIDSSEALKTAEEKVGQKYRRDNGGRMATMILIRGAFYDKKPDTSTWAFMYTSATEPSLVVVVDASNGKVVKTWRG